MTEKQDNWLSEFQARATWQFPMKYSNLDRNLKKMARDQGYSKTDEVLIQLDTVNGGYYVAPCSDPGESLVRCTSCGVQDPINEGVKSLVYISSFV